MNDIKAELRQGMSSLRHPPPKGRERARTSNLSVEEVLLLEPVGWEPVDLVFGASVAAVPTGVWVWGRGELEDVSSAFGIAMATAIRRMEAERDQVAGQGVVGVRVDVDVQLRHVDVVLTGTAVRPTSRRVEGDESFVSGLSARDFALLHGAGWRPAGLAFGASFVYVPRRPAGAALRQLRGNAELTTYTQALAMARESAMDRLQRAAHSLGAQGIVAVEVEQGPLRFARHVVSFTGWGTAVRRHGSAPSAVPPVAVLSLDDRVVQFQATSLRGR